MGDSCAASLGKVEKNGSPAVEVKCPRNQATELSEIKHASEKASSPDENKYTGSKSSLEKVSSKSSLKDSKEMVKIKKKITIMMVVAFLCIIGGLTLGVLWPSLFQHLMATQLVLSPTSKSYQIWKETPVPMYLKIYLYNWTNHDQIGKNPPVTPHFEQIGPYVFREIDKKVNKVWNKNGTITFQQKRVWHFVPSLSNGKLDDSVTNLNPVAATVMYMFRNSKFKKVINILISQLETIVITKKVQEILFDGYEDLLLKLASNIPSISVPFKRFAWFYDRNGSETYDGTFNILTGTTSINDIGMLQQWNYQDTSKSYPKCGKLKGGIGDLWPPLVKNDTVSIFSPDICTTLVLKKSGTSEWLGLTGTKYASDRDMLENGTNVKSRKCYCDSVECQPSGAMNVSTCKFGAPAFVSLPHFYLADPSYRENITGMKPDKKKHEMMLVVQPDTGIPMQVRAALQINLLVNHDPDAKFFKDLPKMYVPMLWFTQEVNLTSEYASQVKLLVVIPDVGLGIFYTVAAIGILLMVISGFLYGRQRIRDDQNERLMPKENENKDKEEDVTINNEQ